MKYYFLERASLGTGTEALGFLGAAGTMEDSPAVPLIHHPLLLETQMET